MSDQLPDIPATTNRAPVIGQQDVAEFGAMMRAAGYSPAAARALIAEMQQLSMQVSIASVAGFLQRFTILDYAKVADLIDRIQTMGGMAGYVRRDAVIAAIHQTLHTNPSVR